MKIRFQLQVGPISTRQQRGALAYGSVWASLRKVAREEGLVGLWRCVDIYFLLNTERGGGGCEENPSLCLMPPPLHPLPLAHTHSGNLAATYLWIGYGAVQVGQTSCARMHAYMTLFYCHIPPASYVFFYGQTPVPSVRGHQAGAAPDAARALAGLSRGRWRGPRGHGCHVPLRRDSHAICRARIATGAFACGCSN